jgi:curved DNA-binding protein
LELNILATDKATGRTKNLQLAKLNTITPPPIKDPLPPKLENSSSEYLFGNAGFADIFQTIFGKSSTERATPVQSKGYQQPLTISMEDAYKGTTHVIQDKGKQKLVRIPAGVQTGSKVRIAGAGPGGLDLYLIISVQPHLFFIRTGLDLFMHYPVSETLAYLGGELKVPILDKGKPMVIVIPPNTKDQQVFRFANRGFPTVKEPTVYGNFYLTVDLYNPETIPQRFKKRLEDINSYMRPQN